MRFKVVDGSQSAHCFFDAMVVDTTKPAWGANRYEAICECFESEDAKMIADALNASERLAKMEAKLHEIGDYAHEHSAGPTVLDHLWTVREMAYGALGAADSAEPRETVTL